LQNASINHYTVSSISYHQSSIQAYWLPVKNQGLAKINI